MCLAIPGKIEKIIDAGKTPRMAEVNFGGVLKEVCIDFIPDLIPGEYVIVHVGYALERINAGEAEKQLRAFLDAEKIIKENYK